jgi:hypothetical protein
VGSDDDDSKSARRWTLWLKVELVIEEVRSADCGFLMVEGWPLRARRFGKRPSAADFENALPEKKAHAVGRVR